MTTTSDRDSLPRNADGWLTEEYVEQREASMPRCPTCDGPITYIHMVQRQTWAFFYEIDNHAGEINGYADEYDSTWTGPESGQVPGSIDYAPLVECENGHEWGEKRLKQGRTLRDWEVLP